MLLRRAGWDLDVQGLSGAPDIRVVISDTIHIVVLKALRVPGFGSAQIVKTPTDANGRVGPDRLPPLDDRTILCLQAGEVNTGEYDPFSLSFRVPRRLEHGCRSTVLSVFGHVSHLFSVIGPRV
jgi:glutamate/tyrosine decarboxylase-like PLP-dependent enzyme